MQTGDMVEFIIFDDGQGILKSDKNRTLEYSCEFHGDHNECWVIEKNRETLEEVSRHNTRFLSSIYLKPKDAEQGVQVDGKATT